MFTIEEERKVRIPAVYLHLAQATAVQKVPDLGSSTGHVTCEAVGHAWLCRMGEDDQQLMSETVNCYWGKFKISEVILS
ncbi:hypothetical protein KCU98_g150, partial [Aureobasidium melanogenum]